MAVNGEHPAVRAVLQEPRTPQPSEAHSGRFSAEHTTSLSLARALAIGCLSRIDPDLMTVNIWDPAAGYGYAGHLLSDALESAGVQVHYRGQDINESAVSVARSRFDGAADSEVALGNSLEHDAFNAFQADLVIVDAPWGMDWRLSAPAVAARRDAGEFGFGVPRFSDSSWLFISLALEKLRPASEGGGRVAALVNPAALSAGGETAAVRRNIVEAGLLESVSRLPDGLAPNTGIPLYLVTLTNRPGTVGRDTVKVADLRTEFTVDRGRRSMPVAGERAY